ncbi:MAG: zf-HC2 domain-containing protein [Steroidobacteraceae bacterium]
MGFTPKVSDPHEKAALLLPWLINGTLDADEAASARTHLAVCPDCRADFEAEQRVYEAVRADGPLVFPGEASFEKLVARIEADEFAAANATLVSSGARAVSSVAPAVSTESSVRGGAAGGAELNRARVSKRTASNRLNARRRFWRSAAALRWLAAAAVIEAVGLGLGAWAWQTRSPTIASSYGVTSASARSNSAPYRTLTTPPARSTAGPRVRVVFRSGLSLDRLQDMLRGAGAQIVGGPSDAHVYTLGFVKPVVSSEALDERIAALRADPNVLFAEPAEDRPP